VRQALRKDGRSIDGIDEPAVGTADTSAFLADDARPRKFTSERLREKRLNRSIGIRHQRAIRFVSGIGSTEVR